MRKSKKKRHAVFSQRAALTKARMHLLALCDSSAHQRVNYPCEHTHMDRERGGNSFARVVSALRWLRPLNIKSCSRPIRAMFCTSDLQHNGPKRTHLFALIFISFLRRRLGAGKEKTGVRSHVEPKAAMGIRDCVKSGCKILMGQIYSKV